MKTVAISANGKDIDADLIENQEGEKLSLTNGCICCTLSADMVSTLQQLDSDYSPDVVILEPSGAADPRSIHTALPYYKGTPLEEIRTVSVLDPLRAEMLMEVMTPLITAQIQHADLVLISKKDLAEPEAIDKAAGYAAEFNPQARVIPIGLDTPIKALIQEIAPWMS